MGWKGNDPIAVTVSSSRWLGHDLTAENRHWLFMVRDRKRSQSLQQPVTTDEMTLGNRFKARFDGLPSNPRPLFLLKVKENCFLWKSLL